MAAGTVLYQRSLIMTPRDRAGDPPGRREAVGDARASSRFSDALRRFACPTGTAVSQGFRTAQCLWTGRMASDAPASPRPGVAGASPAFIEPGGHPPWPPGALLAENLGKPSLGVIIKDLWYNIRIDDTEEDGGAGGRGALSLSARAPGRRTRAPHQRPSQVRDLQIARQRR